ncbi:MAG: hypothetical protein AAGH19_06685 [Pseudomonadota bacterium]
MLFASIVLFVFAAAGIYLACWMFRYEISDARKFGAAAGFVAGLWAAHLLPTRIQFVALLLGPVVLWICLMDDTYDRYAVKQVFGVSLFIAVIGTLAAIYFVF